MHVYHRFFKQPLASVRVPPAPTIPLNDQFMTFTHEFTGRPVDGNKNGGNRCMSVWVLAFQKKKKKFEAFKIVGHHSKGQTHMQARGCCRTRQTVVCFPNRKFWVLFKRPSKNCGSTLKIHMKIFELPPKPNYLLRSAPQQMKSWVRHHP